MFILRAGGESEWQKTTDRGGGEKKGVGSCAQVKRMALDVNMDSSSEVTRGKDEHLLKMQGVWWWVDEDVSME